MSRNFKVGQLLTDAQRSAFNALAVDGRSSIDDLHAWLLDRRHQISRGAVHNYVRDQRRGGLAALRRQLEVRSDPELRRKVAAWTRELSGRDLVSVAFLAAFLAASGTRRGGTTKGS